MSPDTEEYLIYNYVDDTINGERIRCGVPLPMDLPYYYKSFKDRFFGSSIPNLSDQFVCAFQKLPFDIAGITLLSQDAAKIGIGVRQGIRINEKLREFPSEVKVALLHEMIHAKGVRKHCADFQIEIDHLWREQAYLDPLIL